jgi:hypothetical protein
MANFNRNLRFTFQKASHDRTQTGIKLIWANSGSGRYYADTRYSQAEEIVAIRNAAQVIVDTFVPAHLDSPSTVQAIAAAEASPNTQPTRVCKHQLRHDALKKLINEGLAIGRSRVESAKLLLESEDFREEFEDEEAKTLRAKSILGSLWKHEHKTK